MKKLLLLIVLCLAASSHNAAVKVTIMPHDDQELSNQSLRELNNLSDDYSFKKSETVMLPNGQKRTKYKQYYKGVEVFDAAVITKERED